MLARDVIKFVESIIAAMGASGKGDPLPHVLVTLTDPEM